MVGKTENILVDFDSNNIVIVDPNRVIDDNGVVSDRYVKQEDLVMYANLTCQVFPRTKLALGVAANDSIQTISIASINFLSPGGETYLNNRYVDEITGKGALQGKGLNQPNKTTVTNPKDPTDVYLRQNVRSNGEDKATDNGLLGITKINIRQGLDFMPTFDISLEDVKGRALFEAGNSSPYAAFFNMPYPMFELTLKGYYGKGVRYKLMLRSFNARYDYSSGNFIVDLIFHTYQFSIIAEVSMGYLLATPYMYQSKFSVNPRIGSPSTIVPVTNQNAYKGYEKIKEVYAEYKTKGIIPENFPELTIARLRYNLENFVKNVLDNFTKQNLTPLNDITEYENTLLNLRKEIYLAQSVSWFEKYMDTKNYIVLDEPNFGDIKSLLPASADKTLDKLPIGKGKQYDPKKVYTFKPEIKTLGERENAKTELDKIVKAAVKKLNENRTLGSNGKYVVNNKTKESAINIKDSDFKFNAEFTSDDVDLEQTYLLTKNSKVQPTNEELVKFKAELINKGTLKNELNTTYTLKDGERVPVNEYFYYEGKLSFTDKLNDIDNQVKKKRKEIEDDLTNALYDLLKSSNNGIGFVPTIRNVLAVIFASGEGFIRLLDETHKKAWEVRDDKVRKNAIFNSSVSNANPDAITPGVNETVPVYPWPTFLQATMGEDGHEKFEPKYPGENKIIQQTKGYDYTRWPEVEFVEEFIKGFTDRGKSDDFKQPLSNELLDIKRITLNPIEFPISNQVFQNKEVVKYFYEIFERLLFLSTTSRLNRISTTPEVIDIVASIIAQSEVINIKESLSNDNPFLIKTLTDYAFSSNNFVNVLRHISNQGVGVNWQNYIRGIYNTPYIKELNSSNKFLFLDELVIQNPLVRPTVSLDNEDGFIETLTGDSKTNNFDLLDVYPFMDISWIKNQLPGGKNLSKAIEVYNTTKTISFDKKLKTLTNFSLNDGIIPITNFVYKGDKVVPSPEDSITWFYFYRDRTPDKQLITEGNLDYVNYSGGVSTNQTVSMLNTPYFVNAIQDGIVKFRNFDKYPFVTAAYLFLNSLPITTLREKYKVYDSGLNTELDYVFATLKKFGATHKLPYPLIVKLGSIWHRYKKYVNDGVDILDVAWKNFDYLTNYDPVTSATTKNYTLTVDGGVIDIILQKNSTFGTDTSTLINTGFYPKLINDMNVFYQGFEVFSGYTNLGIQSGIDNFKVSLKYVPETLIRGQKGFDPKNPNRDLKVIPWSVYVETTDSQFIYPLPSMGSINNQAYDECFSGPTMNIELTGNTSLYNGTVRNFWSLPTYGYFDNGKVFKNNPKEYLKEMKVGKPDTSNEKLIQENFGIKGDSTKYADISELFSVFEKDILDLFEEKFLNFSKSMYDINRDVDYGFNFQKLMVGMMRIPKPTGSTSNEIVNEIQTKQLNNVNQFLTNFIETSMYVKYGNPGNYDRKLFLSFSNYQITDPYEWTKYQSVTPNALPTLNGGVTLSSSKTNYPNEWKTLETYIGFSEIEKLKYSSNGSYITDFFVDMNVAFTEENIKTYSPIIKIYATQKLQDYVDSAIIPSNEPNTNSYAVLKDGNTIELLPTTNNRLTPVLYDPNKTLLYSGPSRLMFLYSEQDLFDDTITEYYGPFGIQDDLILTTYIRPKGLKLDVPFQSNFNIQNFKVLVDEYIDSLSKFQDKAMNNLMLRLQVTLPSVTETPEQITNSKLTDTIGKLEHWECFKSLNDKWIAGYEYNNKTLFEDVLLLDRASRNIGDKILVDIYKLKSRLDNLFASEPTVDMLSFVESILIENNFVVMNLPSYVNFYNVQEVVKKPTPKLEGTLEFANTLFGTFLNVDVRQSSAKMVCTYAGKPSEYLAIKNVDFKFRDDAFDITKASDNPLLEDQKNKEDWDKSNRVVGFNVDIGPENQSIFFNFSVGQESGTATAESLEVENMMANMSSGKNSATQSISLYNIYKNRSYTCTVSMMGNALIQPTMYFNLRYVPMFHGPYMITQVNHVIGPGVFETTIEGIRQPTASVLKIDDFIQTLKTSLLKSVIDAQKQTTTANPTNAITTQDLMSQTQQTLSVQNKIDETDSCKTSLYKDYAKFTPVDEPTLVTQTIQTVQTKVVSRIANKNITDEGDKLKYVIFAALYLGSYVGDSFKANEHNFSNVRLISKWSSTPNTKFFCKISNGNQSFPYMVFDSIDKNIDFLIDRYKGRMPTITDSSKEEIAKFLILNVENDIPDTVYTQMDKTQLLNLQDKIEESKKLFNPASGNVTPAPPKGPTLVGVYKNYQTTPPSFESLTVTIDPKIDGPRQIRLVQYDYEITADCSNGRATYNDFENNYVSADKQSLTLSKTDLLTDVGCLDTPTNPVKLSERMGEYKFKIRVYTTPVRPDGTPDNARTDTYVSFPITFTS
jgi:hypothetical protein